MALNMETIYYAIAAAMLVIGVIAALIAKSVKSDKAKRNAKAVAEACAEHLKLLQIVKACMIDTEDKKNFNAVEKQAYCKAMIIDQCIEKGIDYMQFDIDEEIANNMEIANNINSTKKVQGEE